LRPNSISRRGKSGQHKRNEIKGINNRGGSVGIKEDSGLKRAADLKTWKVKSKVTGSRLIIEKDGHKKRKDQ